MPFCASTCDFCAFYQERPTAAAIRGFLDGIAAEAALVGWPGAATTVFWGGGTPGMLAPEGPGAPGRHRARPPRAGPRAGPAPGPPDREWTVELAPASVTAERLAVLRDLGVTRLSLGVQSFQPRWLEALGPPAHAASRSTGPTSASGRRAGRT